MSFPTIPYSTTTSSQDQYDGVAYAALANPVVAAEAVTEAPTTLPSNPYAAPVSDIAVARTLDPSNDMLPQWKLDRIKWFFTYSQIAFALYILAFVSVMITAESYYVPGIFILMAYALGFAFWTLLTGLSYQVRGLTSAVFTGIFLQVPLLNLVTIIVAVRHTHELMKRHGYKCGMFRVKLDKAARDAAYAEAAQLASISTDKPERSPVAMAITYAIIGLLVGLVVISAITTVGASQ